MAVEDRTRNHRGTTAAASGPLAALPPADRELAIAVATLLVDTVGVFANGVTRFVYEQVPNLPTDADAVKALEIHAEANALEVLTSLRAELPPDAYQAPREAIAHADYLRSRGIPFDSLLAIYRHGFGVFRELITSEIRRRTGDPGQVQRVANVFDGYGFPFVMSTLRRLSYEWGGNSAGWTPGPGDAEFVSDATHRAAELIRLGAEREGRWTAATVAESGARARARAELEHFADRLEDGVREYGLSDRLAQAKTSVTLTLRDEPDLAVSVMLDRSPVEVIDGEAPTAAQIYIASTDLNRIWSPQFYLPMAIAKGRVRTVGPAREFLRILPIIRSFGGNAAGHGSHETIAA